MGVPKYEFRNLQELKKMTKKRFSLLLNINLINEF